jgi:transposase InsO family protein
MQAHRRQFPVAVMCAVLKVSRSGYYAWCQRPVCARRQQAEALREQIRTIHRASRGTYGSPRVWHDLRAQGHGCGRHRVARLMRKDGLRAKVKRRFKATTDSRHQLPVAANLVSRDFSPEAPNRLWAGDITYVWTAEGWLYLAVVLDLFSRMVVGFRHVGADGPRVGHGRLAHGPGPQAPWGGRDPPFGPWCAIRQR